MTRLLITRCLKVSGNYSSLFCSLLTCRPVTEAIRLEKEAKQSSTYKSLFTDKANLRRMRIIIPLAFFSQWSGVSEFGADPTLTPTEWHRIVLPGPRPGWYRYHPSQRPNLDQRYLKSLELWPSHRQLDGRGPIRAEENVPDLGRGHVSRFQRLDG